MSKGPTKNEISEVRVIGLHRKMQKQFGFNDESLHDNKEVNVELFAGAGGFGAGAQMAGMPFHVAINHNPIALAVHAVNFPHATQMINDVFEYNPVDVLISQGVSLMALAAIKNWKHEEILKYVVGHLHLSPDCTFFSRSKGGPLGRHSVCGDDCEIDHTQLDQDTAERIRSLAWVGIGWCAAVRPRRVTLENVEEFRKWGPTIVLENGDVVPDKKREGETFNAFVGVLSTGIEATVEKPLPKISNFIDPNDIPKRKRKIYTQKKWSELIKWLNQISIEDISWRGLSPWHGWRMEHPALKDIRKYLKPFLGDDYNEQELIDGLGYDVEFKELVASDYGSNTSRRRLFMIARCDGVPIIWPRITHGNPKSKEVQDGKLLPWRSAAECIDWSLACASIFESKEEIKASLGLSVRRPLKPNTLARIARGVKKFVLDTESPFIVKNMNKNVPRGIDEPVSTILTGNHHYLAMPYIQTYYGDTGVKNEARGNFLSNPLATITAGGLRHALTAAYIVNAKGTNPKTMAIGNRAKEPVTTITTSDSHGIVMAHLSRDFGQSIGADINNPAPTITAGGGGKSSLIASHCIRVQKGHFPSVLATHLYKYYGADKHGQSIKEPLHTIRTKECFGLISEELIKQSSIMSDEMRYKAWQVARLMEEYAGFEVPYLGGIPLPRDSYITTRNGDIVADIGMRMLTERELYTAQGFKKSFVFDPDVEITDAKGRKKVKKISKKDIVRMIGNSVPPHFAMALISAMDEAEELHYNYLNEIS